MGRLKPNVFFWIVAFVSSAYLVAISLLDAACFFGLGTHLRWIVAAGYVAVIWPLLFGQRGRVERPITRTKPDAVFWIVALLAAACLVAVSLLDAACFFEIGGTPQRCIVAAGYVAFTWPLLLSPHGRAVLGIALLWMLVVLPQVRWNHIKSFYVDARRLEPGMQETEVREIMAPYLEVGRTYQPTPEEQDWGLAADPRENMLFIHSALGWTDHCEVKLDEQGRARAIHIEKD